jgi:hypothetical protein
LPSRGDNAFGGLNTAMRGLPRRGSAPVAPRAEGQPRPGRAAAHSAAQIVKHYPKPAGRGTTAPGAVLPTSNFCNEKAPKFQCSELDEGSWHMSDALPSKILKDIIKASGGVRRE